MQPVGRCSFPSKRASSSSVISPDANRPRAATVLQRCALGMALVACAACGASRVAPARLLSPADVDLYARVLAAADARRSDTTVVMAAIASAAPAVRREGVLAAGQLRLQSATHALRALLHDGDT